MPQLVARFKEGQGGERYGKQAARNYRRANPGRHVGNAEETVAKTVDHVEKGIGVGQSPPELGQRMDRIEHAREHRCRKYHEILEKGELVDFFSPEAGKQAERAEQSGPEKRERKRPSRRCELEIDESKGDGKNPRTHKKPASRRGQHVGGEELRIRD